MNKRQDDGLMLGLLTIAIGVFIWIIGMLVLITGGF